MLLMKKCTKCNETKKLTEFKMRVDGYRNSWCQSCKIELNKIYVKNNSDKSKISRKNSTQKYHKKISAGVYLIKNLITGDFYIGQSKQPIRRVNHHFALTSKLPWLNNITKNDYLIWGIIEHCSEDKLLEREQYWINKLKPKYNA